MAVDMFLKLDGITGESTDQFHKGEIDILSFSWGASAPTAIGSGQGTGRGSRQSQSLSLNFTKITDSASPQIFDKWCGGDAIKTAVLTARESSSPSVSEITSVGTAAAVDYFLKITLTDVLVSSVNLAGSNGQGSPMDQVSLNFAKIEFAVLSPTGQFVDSSCSAFLK